MNHSDNTNSSTDQLQLPAPWDVPPAHGLVIHVKPEWWMPAKAKTKTIRYRLSNAGGGRGSTISHATSPEGVNQDAKAWAKELNDGDCHRSPVAVKDRRRAAVLYAECTEALAKYAVTPLTACLGWAQLILLMGVDHVNELIAVYLPLLRACKPLLVEAGVDEYWKKLFGSREPDTCDEKRKAKCLRLFKKRFGAKDFRYVSKPEGEAFLYELTPNQDTWNKYLSYLRKLFIWARDDKQALPAGQSTVFQMLIGKKPKFRRPSIYAPQAYAWLVSFAPDRDMTLALLLAGRFFLRQEEAEKMRGEFFHRDRHGRVVEIVVPIGVAKPGCERTIPVEDQHFQKLFAKIVPVSGPLFHTDDPYGRIHDLARALGICVVSNGFRHGCVSYDIAAGMTRELAAKLAGHNLQTQGKFYYVLVSQAEGQAYMRIAFPIDRIAALPAYKKVVYKKLAAGRKFPQRCAAKTQGKIGCLAP